MDTENRDLQSMAAVELANMTIYSVCNNEEFPKRIHIDQRLISRYEFYYVSSGMKENERAKRSIIRMMNNGKNKEIVRSRKTGPASREEVIKNEKD